MRRGVRGRVNAASPPEAAFSMADSTTRTIVLNGDPYVIDGEIRLVALLERLEMRQTRVAVEINHEIVPKASYAQTVIKPGDNVEIINFVGGG
jgi:sulfur carrier protein